MTNSEASFKSFWLIANEISIIDEEESRNGNETSLHFINVSYLFDSFGNFLCHFGNQYKIRLNTRLSCSARDKIKDWKRLYHQLSIAGDHIAVRNHFFFFPPSKHYSASMNSRQGPDAHTLWLWIHSTKGWDSWRLSVWSINTDRPGRNYCSHPPPPSISPILTKSWINQLT